MASRAYSNFGGAKDFYDQELFFQTNVVIGFCLIFDIIPCDSVYTVGTCTCISLKIGAG